VETNYHLLWELERLRDEYRVEPNNLRRLLDPIEQELTEIDACLAGLTPPSDEHEQWAYESFREAKGDEVEGLLAVAFVIAQTHVTQVVSRTMRVLEAAQLAGRSLTAFAPSPEVSRDHVLRAASDVVPGTDYTQVQVLDAFANYFKHHEEWRGKWADLKGKAGKTAKVIAAAGAAKGYVGNFRAGAEVLGNGSYKNVGVFVSIISTWRSGLVEALENAAHEAAPL
jgi:hypothetical protein